MGTDIHASFQIKRDGQWVDVESTWEQHRHYFLFAWLAGVRNGVGFAGVPTHEPIRPISEPRGLPDDLGGDGDDECDFGDHHQSWLSADEILSAPLPGATMRTGVIDRKDFELWDKKSRPHSYCGAIAGPGVVVSPVDEVGDPTTHVQVSWCENGADELQYFVDEVRRLRTAHGVVRLVFGFDS